MKQEEMSYQTDCIYDLITGANFGIGMLSDSISDLTSIQYDDIFLNERDKLKSLIQRLWNSIDELKEIKNEINNLYTEYYQE